MGRKKSNSEIQEIENIGLRSKIVVKGKELTEKQKLFLKIACDENTKVVFVGPAGSTQNLHGCICSSTPAKEL